MQAAMHVPTTASAKFRTGFRVTFRSAVCIGFIVASTFQSTRAKAEEPPSDWIRRAAQRESENELARSNYTYHQTVVVQELDSHGMSGGEYREARDIVFLTSGERFEQLVARPSDTLKHLRLTDEDFRDLREVQPMLLTTEAARLYETRFRGEETIDGVECFVLGIRPRQLLQGQRLFDGMLWIAKAGFATIRSEGQPEAQIQTQKAENLFPHFTTIRQEVDGKFWFPVTTYGDDTLYFRRLPQHPRLTIRYRDYRKFSTDSSITFEK